MNLNCGFLKFQFGKQLRENQNNPSTIQICFETFNLFQVWYKMYLNWGFLKFQFGKRLRENQDNPNTTQICFETCNSF